MSSNVCTSRLRKELRELQKKPVENIRALPKESNILEWHYVIEGQKGSPYEGGWYHGTVTFPAQYPYKPPTIQMITPNGRFKPSTPLCLSMSDFHPESWNPMWSVGTILMGLQSFLYESTPTHGSIVTTHSFKRQSARESLAYNCQNKTFRELFPELIELYEKTKDLPVVDTVYDAVSNTLSAGAAAGGRPNRPENASWAAILGMLAAIVACTWAILAMSL